MKQGTQSQCPGTAQRDRMGREVGSGLQEGGTHVYLWMIHVDSWKKNHRSVIILQLNKLINKDIMKVRQSKDHDLLCKISTEICIH